MNTIAITAVYLLGAVITYKLRRTATDRELAHAQRKLEGLDRHRSRIRRQLTLGISIVSAVWPLTWLLRLVAEAIYRTASPAQQDAMRAWFQSATRRRSHEA